VLRQRRFDAGATMAKGPFPTAATQAGFRQCRRVRVARARGRSR